MPALSPSGKQPGLTKADRLRKKRLEAQARRIRLLEGVGPKGNKKRSPTMEVGPKKQHPRHSTYKGPKTRAGQQVARAVQKKDDLGRPQRLRNYESTGSAAKRGAYRVADWYSGIGTAYHDPSPANIGWAVLNVVPVGKPIRAIGRVGESFVRSAESVDRQASRGWKTVGHKDYYQAEVPTFDSRLLGVFDTGSLTRGAARIHARVAPKSASTLAAKTKRKELDFRQKLWEAQHAGLVNLAHDLDNPELMALNMVADGRTPAERIAFINREQANAERTISELRAKLDDTGVVSPRSFSINKKIDEQQLRINGMDYQRSLVQRAADLVRPSTGKGGKGALELNPETASDALKQTWDMMNVVQGRREDVMRSLGILSEDIMYARINKPGRIIGGARWLTPAEQYALKIVSGTVTIRSRIAKLDKEREVLDRSRKRALAKKRGLEVPEDDAEFSGMTVREMKDRIEAIDNEKDLVLEAQQLVRPAPDGKGYVIDREAASNNLIEASQFSESTRTKAATVIAMQQQVQEINRELKTLRYRATRLEKSKKKGSAAEARAVRSEIQQKVKQRDALNREVRKHPDEFTNESIDAINANLDIASGGRSEGMIVGNESYDGGSMYVSSQRGLPINQSRFSERLRGSMRWTVPWIGGGSWRTVISGLRRDPSLTKEYRGEVLQSGLFRIDAPRLVGEALARASRLVHTRDMRDEMLKFGVSYKKAMERCENDTGLLLEEYRPVLNFESVVLPKGWKSPISSTTWDLLHSTAIDEKTLMELAPQEFEEIFNHVFPSAKKLLEDLIDDPIKMTGEKLRKDSPLVLWVRRDVTNSFGKELEKWSLSRFVQNNKSMQRGLNALMLLPDWYRIATVYAVPPAYIVPNALSNVGLLALQQGFHLAGDVTTGANRKLFGGVRPQYQALIDATGGNGQVVAVMSLQNSILRSKMRGYTALLSKATDLIPRRTAVLYELRKAGYKTPESVEALYDAFFRGDKNAQKQLYKVYVNANKAMLHFDNLNNIESSIVKNILFLYPFLKSSTEYTLRFPLAHPHVSAAGLYGYREQQKAKEEALGPGPWYEQFLVKVPDEIVDHIPWAQQAMQYTWDVSKLVPFGRPVDFAQSIVSVLTGDDNGSKFFENFAPHLQVFHTMLTGYDASIGRDVEGNIADRFLAGTKEFVRPYRMYQNLTMTDAERKEKLKPRKPADVVADFLIGSTNISPRNPKVAQELSGVAESPEFKNDADFQEAVTELQSRVEKAGGTLPQWVPTVLAVRREFYVAKWYLQQQLSQQQDFMANQEQLPKSERRSQTEIGLTTRQEIGVLLAVLNTMRPDLRGAIASAQRYLRQNLSEDDLKKLLSQIRDAAGFNALSSLRSQLTELGL